MVQVTHATTPYHLHLPDLFASSLQGTTGPSVAVPEVGEGEVLVRVLSVGICAGDAKCFAGAPYFWGERRCSNCCQLATRTVTYSIYFSFDGPKFLKKQFCNVWSLEQDSLVVYEAKAFATHSHCSVWCGV